MIKLAKLCGPALITGALAFGSACSGTADGAGPSVTPPPLSPNAAPTSFEAAQAALPLSRYKETQDEQKVIKKALDILIVACVKRSGFPDFTSKSLDSPAGSDASGEPGGSYGLIDAKNAAKHGFHQRYRVVRADGASPWARTLPTCEVLAAKDLDGGKKVDSVTLVGKILETSDKLTTADSRMRKATSAWSACMRSKGFTYERPPTRDDWVKPMAEDTVSRTEISTALADVSCTSSTHLSTMYFALMNGYQTQLIGTYQRPLALVRSEINMRLANAHKVIGSPS